LEEVYNENTTNHRYPPIAIEQVLLFKPESQNGWGWKGPLV